MLNFPSVCSEDWNICTEYYLKGQLPLTGTRKPTFKCLITRPDYPLLQGPIIPYGNISHCQNALHLKTCRFETKPISKYSILWFTYKQSNAMKGFANETACVSRVLIWHICIYLKLSIEKIRIEVSFLNCRKIALWCIGFLVPVRVNAYHIYLKYSDISTPYHTYSKTWTITIYYLMFI